MNVTRHIIDDIYDLRLKYTVLALGSAEDPLRPAESHPKLRMGHISQRDGSLGSEEGLFMPTKDSHRQSTNVFGSTEGLVSSARRPEGLLMPAKGHSG